MIKKKSNFSIHEIDLLTNIQSINIMSNFWVMWNCYFFFFYFTYFYTTYITHVNNKYTVIYLQICLEWTLAIATVHQKEHTMYRYYYISSIAKGFLSAPLLNNDPTRANQKPLPSEDCTGTSSHVISCTHTQVTDDFSCPNH